MESPHRRHVLIVKIESDTKEALIRDVNHVLYYVARELPERGTVDSVMGGVESSNTIVYSEDQTITHESYWQSLLAFMESRNEAG